MNGSAPIEGAGDGAAASRAPRPAGEVRPRILVVEDSATQAELLRFGLEEGGYSVTVAGNGVEGLALARQSPPALIMSDVVMPQLDGYDLCRFVRADPALAHIPVLLMTMLSSPDDVLRALECGADNFLRKPCDVPHLLASIHSLLTNRERRAHAAGDEALPGTGQARLGVETAIEVQFAGRTHRITSGRQQVLDLLISTYEQAVRINGELRLKDALLQRSYDAIEALYRLANDVNAAETPPQVFEITLAHAIDLAGATAGWIWLDEGQGRLRQAAASGLPSFLPSPEAMQGECDCQQLLAAGRLDRAVNIARCQRGTSAAADGLQHVSVGLRSGEDTIGILNLVVPAPINSEGLRILDVLANRVASRLARMQLQEQLKASNQELEAFAYSVAHDLRAPARHMDGFAGLLSERLGSELDETSLHFVRTIQSAAVKMGRLIDDLLGLSRTGRAALKPERVELGELVRDIQQDLTSASTGRRIVWSIEPMPAVNADPGLLRIALVNLMSNAVKYSAPRGESHIAIGATMRDGEVVVQIRDNGVGFDMRFADKLFGVFQRLHSDEEFEGTGIGLATVRRIISRHGGRVWAEGEVGHGSTFSFSLPRGG